MFFREIPNSTLLNASRAIEIKMIYLIRDNNLSEKELAALNKYIQNPFILNIMARSVYKEWESHNRNIHFDRLMKAVVVNILEAANQ